MKAFIVLALAAVALADNAPYRPAPAYNAYRPAYNSYQRPSYQNDYAEPANYQYAYEVNDPHYGPRFNAEESRNGYATNGQYSVDLPDGRVQTVTYNVADDYSGYIADVQYQGEAQYPEYNPRPAYHAAEPAYNAYAPRPAYNTYAPRPAYNAYAPRPAYHA